MNNRSDANKSLAEPSSSGRRRRRRSAVVALAQFCCCSNARLSLPGAAAAFVVPPAAEPRFFSSRRRTSSSAPALLMYADETNNAAGGGGLSGSGLSGGGGSSGRSSNEGGGGPPSQRYLDELGHPIEEKKIDYVGAGTLGDIMSSEESPDDVAAVVDLAASVVAVGKEDGGGGGEDTATTRTTAIDEGLVTTAGGTLRSRFGSKVPDLTPLDRIALTANGNLQRIVSSYYDAPVHVHVDRCEMRAASAGAAAAACAGAGEDVDDGGREGVNGAGFFLLRGPNGRSSNGAVDGTNGVPLLNNGRASGSIGSSNSPAVWDREVHLSVHSRRFCTATSVVAVHSPECVRLVHSGKVGIGQLFRHLDKLPTFALLDAGRTVEGGLWREYALRCDELTCFIREEFVRDAWDIVPGSS